MWATATGFVWDVKLRGRIFTGGVSTSFRKLSQAEIEKRRDDHSEKVCELWSVDTSKRWRRWYLFQSNRGIESQIRENRRTGVDCRVADDLIERIASCCWWRRIDEDFVDGIGRWCRCFDGWIDGDTYQSEGLEILSVLDTSSLPLLTANLRWSREIATMLIIIRRCLLI